MSGILASALEGVNQGKNDRAQEGSVNPTHTTATPSKYHKITQDRSLVVPNHLLKATAVGLDSKKIALLEEKRYKAALAKNKRDQKASDKINIK